MKKVKFDNYYIISGGPGSGKSALIAALAERGFKTMPEAGRSIIQAQRLIGGRALPWDDRTAFAELMLQWELRSYREAQNHAGPVFFDRGVPDVIGYLRLVGLKVPEHLKQAAFLFRYHPRVFLAPPWREIFHADDERRQSWAEAVATYGSMLGVYTEFGYKIVTLPLISIEERTDFILKTLAEID